MEWFISIINMILKLNMYNLRDEISFIVMPVDLCLARGLRSLYR